MVLLRSASKIGGVAEIEAMIPDLDIYRSANLLVKRYGEDAPTQAARQGDHRDRALSGTQGQG